MSLELASPFALAALASLVVPVLVHLVRRSEHRVTPFAALRFLAPAGLPRRRIRLVELGLLVLRCLLVAVVVAWLAQPFVRQALEVARLSAVDTSVPREVARAALGAEPADRAVWIAPGFPALAEPPPQGVQPSASLVRELDASLARDAALALVVPERVAGLDGARPVLGREIAWHVVEGLKAPAAEDARVPLRIAWHAPDGDPAARVLAAVEAAWAAAPEPAARATRLGADAPSPGDADALVWAGGPLPAAFTRWIEAGGLALVAGDATFAPQPPDSIIARDSGGEPLVLERRLGRGVLRALAVPFDPAGLPLVHDASFPDALRQWLARSEPMPTVGVAASLRPARGTVAASPPREPLAPWLALAAAVLFVVERAWAAGLARRRAA